MIYKLVDLSHFNGVPDLVTAKARGHISGVIIKATEGLTYADPLAGPIADAAVKAGLPIGYYHFGRPGQGNPEGQARFFLNTVAALPAPNIRLALDHEVSDGLPATQVADFGRRFEATLQETVGYVPLVYSYDSFIQDGNCAGLGSYLLWFARYGTPNFPTAPSPFTSRVALWQAGQFVVPGVQAGDGPGVDVDWTTDLAALLIPHTTSGEADLDMFIALNSTGGTAFIVDATGRRHLGPAQLAAYKQAGLRVVQFADDGVLKAITAVGDDPL